MAGPHYTKASRSTSSSPRLKCNSPSKSKSKEFGSSQQQIQTEHHSYRSKSCSPQKCSIPLQRGRRQSPIVSPTPIPSENKSKSLTARSSPVVLKSAVTCDLLEKLSKSPDEDIDGSLAVPKIAAMPPKPTFLPRPPTHWFGEFDSQCQAYKQQCRVETQCLMSHLSSSGILVFAQ